MRTLDEISDHELRVADWINAVDESSARWETLWGLDEPAALPTAKQQRIIEVSISQNDEVSLLKAIDRVEQVKGRLAPRVEALRVVLKRSTSTLRSPSSGGIAGEPPPFERTEPLNG